jgi:hypothetical protein
MMGVTLQKQLHGTHFFQSRTGYIGNVYFHLKMSAARTVVQHAIKSEMKVNALRV